MFLARAACCALTLACLFAAPASASAAGSSLKSCGSIVLEREGAGPSPYVLQQRGTTCATARRLMRLAASRLYGKRGQKRTVAGWKCANVDPGYTPGKPLISCTRTRSGTRSTVRLVYSAETSGGESEPSTQNTLPYELCDGADPVITGLATARMSCQDGGRLARRWVEKCGRVEGPCTLPGWKCRVTSTSDVGGAARCETSTRGVSFEYLP